MGRKLCSELARVTETAALAASQWIGKGNMSSIDGAAIEAMHSVLSDLGISGEVVIGGGSKDKTSMLYNGELIGDELGLGLDIAIGPVEGTSLVAKGLSNALSVITLVEKGSLLKVPNMYMHKIAVGPEAKDVIDINATPVDNLIAVAKAKGKKINEMTVVILDRPRNKEIISDLYKKGARIKLISDGDVAAGISTALSDTGIDMLIGIGGAHQGVLTAAALKCMGGYMETKLVFKDEKEVEVANMMGIEDTDKIYTINDIVKGEDILFTATGITGGELLDRVVYNGDQAATNSLLLDGLSKEVLRINTIHNLDEEESKVNRIG